MFVSTCTRACQVPTPSHHQKIIRLATHTHDVLSTTRHVRARCDRAMRARSLFLCAGAPLCGLAQEILPPGGRGNPAYPTKAGSKRTKSSTQQHASSSRSSRSHAQPRGLQLHLKDDSGEEPMARSDVAYAALLMDDHDRGIRTLGQSLIDSRTSADLVAILGAGVTKVTETRMRAQGWRIRRLAEGGVDGDGGGVHKLDSASESVLAHASVWALTDYKRVVLLSDNMLVVENIDDLFLCEGICAAMQQAEVVSTSLIVLEPDLDIYEHMSRSVGTIYNFSNNFQGFLNTYLAGFETCAFFDLENPCLQDPSTDPNRGPDAPLLDHSCHRLPTRYNGDLALVMLNGGLGMVRTKNAMPEEWWRQRRARVVRFEFAGLRPWMWFASPFLPFVSTWESTHLRAKPGDPSPSVFWVVLVWLAFVAAFLFGGRAVLVPVVSGRITKGEAPSKCAGGWRAWVPRALAWKRKRRGSSASSYNPRGLLWSLVHLAVGYSSLLCAVAVGVVQVPAASTVKMSWIVFITWTGTLFGTLWSAYLWFISRQPQLSPRAFMIGNGPLDLASINTNLCPVPGGGGGSSTDPFKPKLAGGGSAAGSVLKVGGVVTPSPWRESVTSLTLLVAVLAFLPAWKPMSGAASLPTLLVPAAVALVAMFVGLTVQMVRLPVLWCDRLKFLALMEKEGLRPCGSCGRVDY